MFCFWTKLWLLYRRTLIENPKIIINNSNPYLTWATNRFRFKMPNFKLIIIITFRPVSRLQIKCHAIQTNQSILPFFLIILWVCVSSLKFFFSNFQPSKNRHFCMLCYIYIYLLLKNVKHFAIVDCELWIVDLSLAVALSLSVVGCSNTWSAFFFFRNWKKWMGPSTHSANHSFNTLQQPLRWTQSFSHDFSLLKSNTHDK